MHIGGACDASVNILNEIEIEKLYFVFWDTGKRTEPNSKSDLYR